MSSKPQKNTNQKTSKKVQPTVAEPIAQAPKSYTKLWALIIFLFSGLLYVNTLHHEWVLDDYGAMVNNIFVNKGTAGFKDIMTHTYRYGSGLFTDNLYRPLSQLVFALEWQISPDNQMLAHAVNVIFYALCCMLLFMALNKLFQGKHKALAIIIALLYSAHPIHTEVVANVKGLDDILALLFTLLSLICVLQYVDTRKWYYLPLLFINFLLAMFAKESTITWLAVFPLVLYFFRDVKLKDHFIILLIVAVPTIIYFYARYRVVTAYDFGPFKVSVVDNYFYNESLFTGWATSIMLLGKYLIQLFVPVTMVCDYSFSQLPLVTFASYKTWISLLIHLALVVYAIKTIKQKDLISFGILFYIVTMSIFSNLVYRIGSSFADRFLFLPSIGFCVAIGALLYKLFKVAEKKNFTLKTQPILCCLLAVILVLYSGKTVSRAADWQSQYKLFSTDVKKSDKSAHMRMYWGLALRDKGNDYYEENKFENDPVKRQENYNHFEEWAWKSIAQFKEGIRIYPQYADCYEQLGIVYSRLAEVHPEQNYLDSAETFFLTGLHYLPSKATMLSNLAKLYFEHEQVDKAKIYYQKAVLYDPRYADGYYNLGSVYGQQAKYDSSFYYYRKSIEIDPDRAEAFSSMGLNYYNMQKYDSAVVYYDKAIAMEPRSYDMQYMKAVILYYAQKYDEAIAAEMKALSLSPRDGEGYYLMGLCENKLEHLDKALQNFSKCIELNPAKLEAYYSKYLIFEQRHQMDSARYYMDFLQKASR